MPQLQDSLSMGGLVLSNRLVMAPMVTGLAMDHQVTEAHLEWYGARVGGLGLAILECAAVAMEGLILPGQLGIWSDAFIPGLARLADHVRKKGTPAVLQLVHGGARALDLGLPGSRVGASSVRVAAGRHPRALGLEEMPAVTEAFAASAHRAKQAGMDGIEIHAAHGYLLSQFLTPRVNMRSDDYGGSLAGRSRLLLEVVRAIRARVGEDYPILVRMHAAERLEGGLQEEEAALLAEWLEAEGVAALDLSGIAQSSMATDDLGEYLLSSSVGSRSWTPGAFSEPTGRIKASLRVPVIAVGRMAESNLAETLIRDQKADLIALGRQLIADPDAGRKLLAGEGEAIRRCTECLGCFARIRKGAIGCTRWS